MTTPKKNIQNLAAFSIDTTSQFFVKGGGLPIGFSSGVHNDPNIQGGGGNDTLDKSSPLVVSDQNLKKDIQKLAAFGLDNKKLGFVKGGGLLLGELGINNNPDIQGGGGNDTLDKSSPLVVSDQNLKKEIQNLAAFSIDTTSQFFVKGGGLPIGFSSGIHNDPNIQGGGGNDTLDKSSPLVVSDQNLKKGIQKLAV